MPKYKVPFSGFALVEADSAEEAYDKAVDDDAVLVDTEFADPVEIDSFDGYWEGDYD